MNLHPDEEPLGLQLFARKKYDFVNLTTPSKEWAAENWDIHGSGTAFLLDGQGRIIFRPELGNAEGQRIFERQIEALLSGAPRSR